MSAPFRAITTTRAVAVERDDDGNVIHEAVTVDETPSPVATDSEGTRLLPRRDHGGRFAPRATFPTCAGCGWTLAENLAAVTYCPHQTCDAYRKPVGVVAGINLGTLTADMLEVEK